MSASERLAEVLTALEAVGVRCLVMGGHAVRYYGLDRMTDDFDLHLAPDCWGDLPDRLAQSDWFRARGLVEVASWRARDFRRYQIGVLPSGREEWLEFWKGNHLLPAFADAYERRESGAYGGRVCDFLSLTDLIRAKETEREKDWVDIEYLEEIQDARLAAAALQGELPLPLSLSQLRSRRGLETHLRAGTVSDRAVVADALRLADNPITLALLLPFAAETAIETVPIEPAIESRLRTVLGASPLHLTMVEAVRRRYKHDAKELDKADKRAISERLRR